MSELESQIQKLTVMVRRLHGCPESWSEIQIVEDPLFSYRGETWKIPEVALKSVKEYEGKFCELLNGGYSWINLNFAGIFKNRAIVFVEYPSQSSGCPKEKVSVNHSGPEGNVWDLSKKLCIAH